MFEVGLLEKGFGTDFLKGDIGIVHAAVKTVSILMFAKKILFNALGTGGFFAEFATHFLSNNGSISVCAYVAGFCFHCSRWINDNIRFLGHVG